MAGSHLNLNKYWSNLISLSTVVIAHKSYVFHNKNTLNKPKLNCVQTGLHQENVNEIGVVTDDTAFEIRACPLIRDKWQFWAEK